MSDTPISRPVIRVAPKLKDRPLRDFPQDALTYFIQYLEATRRKHLQRIPKHLAEPLADLIELAHEEKRARIVREENSTRFNVPRDGR